MSSEKITVKSKEKGFGNVDQETLHRAEVKFEPTSVWT